MDWLYNQVRSLLGLDTPTYAGSMPFGRLVRFVPRGNGGSVLIGEPIDEKQDVGRAVRAGEAVRVRVFSGTSALNAGRPTGRIEVVERLLCPVTQREAGTIRCIGLNYRQHAREVGMPIPDEPTVFLKPQTALGDPYPAPTYIPRFTVAHDCADYESELAIIIGRDCKDVSESEATSYILGYCAANDVSSRKAQLGSSQWCFSKGFDGACPVGPVLVSPSLVPDVGVLRIKGFKNGVKKQDCGIDDFIFTIPRLLAFLSQGTTLTAGTVIITGTPAGVGMATKDYLKDGDEFSVEISPYIGTLITKFKAEI